MLNVKSKVSLLEVIATILVLADAHLRYNLAGRHINAHILHRLPHLSC